MSNEEWTWQLRRPAKRTYDKLDEIVTDRWREPGDYLEPLTGAPHSKLRIGQFRLGTECDHDKNILDVYTIEQRGMSNAQYEGREEWDAGPTTSGPDTSVPRRNCERPKGASSYRNSSRAASSASTSASTSSRVL